MGEVATLLITLGVWVGIFATTHATHKTCPPGWYVNGVRPSGKFGCRPVPKLQAAEDVAPYRTQPPLLGEDRESYDQIYCVGTRPIVVNWRTVGCQPR